MSRNTLPAASSISPLKTFLAAAATPARDPNGSQSRAVSANAISTGIKGQHDAWEKPEQEAWERNLMAVTAMRGKLGEIAQGIQEWKTTSTALQSLAKEVQQLSASQSSLNQLLHQKTGTTDENPASKAHLDTVRAELVQQAEGIQSQLSQQIVQQTSVVNKELSRIKDQLSMLQAEVKITSQDSEKLMKFNVDLSKTLDIRLRELNDTHAALHAQSRTLEQTVAKGLHYEEDDRQKGMGGVVTTATSTCDKSTSTHQITTSRTSSSASEQEDDEKQKGKTADYGDDMPNKTLEILSGALSKALQSAINDKAGEVSAAYRANMEERLDQIEHKLDLLLSARGSLAVATNANVEAKPSTPGLVPRLSSSDVALAAAQASPGKGKKPSLVDLLNDTPRQFSNGESSAQAVGGVNLNLIEMSERKHDASPLARRTDMDMMPQEFDSDEAKEEVPIAVTTDQAIGLRQNEREVSGTRITSSGAKKRMLITFSSSDEEADESVNTNVKRLRPTHGLGTKSLTPPKTACDPSGVACKPKSSSATVASKRSEVAERASTDLPIRPVAGGARGRRLSVSPELP